MRAVVGGLVLAAALSSCSSPAPPPPQPNAAVASPAPAPGPLVEEDPRLPRREIQIALTGDFLIHSNVWARAATPNGFDFYPLIAPVAKTIKRADLALCHLETPLAPRGGPYESYPLFAAPAALLPAVKKAGYDGCTLASNHTVDQGFEGVRRTVQYVEEAGLGHTGAYGAANQDRVQYYEVRGLRVASLSYTYGTNGMPVEKTWSVNMIEPERIVRDARQARRAGADVVLVGLHWGDEYQTEPSQAQLALADRLTRVGAIDLIYGHHAHVVQPVRRINGRWVLFGLGNFLAGQAYYMPGVNEGSIGVVTMVRRPDGSVVVKRPRMVPTVIGPDLVVRYGR